MHPYLEYEKEVIGLIAAVEGWLKERDIDVEREATASLDRPTDFHQHCYHGLRHEGDPLLALNWTVQNIGETSINFHFEMCWARSHGQCCWMFVKFYPRQNVWLAGTRLEDRHDAELPEEVKSLSLFKENLEFAPLRHALHSRPTFVDKQHPDGNPENPPVETERAWQLMVDLIDYFVEQRRKTTT
jgi:hypothetical protein